MPRMGWIRPIPARGDKSPNGPGNPCVFFRRELREVWREKELEVSNQLVERERALTFPDQDPSQAVEPKNKEQQKSKGEIQRRSAVTASCRSRMSLVKIKYKEVGVGQLKCKCWDCVECGPRNRRRLQDRARRGCPNKFLTITSGPGNTGTPSEQACVLKKGWKNTRQYLKRHGLKEKIHFIAVWELTKAGNPHLHLLLRSKYIPQKLISDLMDRYCNSPIVDIRAVKNQRVASFYITKYIAKNPARFKGCKRHWSSMDWEEIPDPYKCVKKITDHPWRVKFTDYLEVKAELKRQGYLQVLGEENSTWLWVENKAPPRTLQENWFPT